MRFNFSQKGKQPADTRYAHVKAGLPDAQWDLLTTLVSGSLTASPAEHKTEDLETLRREVRAHDAALIERLAIYLAEEKNFRELALLLTAELAAIVGNDEGTGALVARIVRVPMDIPLWLDYYARATRPGRKPGRAVRKHLALLFNKLDEYQFSRSSRASQLALRDALLWLRPKAADRTKKLLFGAILRDHIRIRTTWQQEWHALHQQNYDSAEQRQLALRDKWKEGISSFRIGYAPLLDNLRPMLCAGISGKVLKLAAEYLGNPAAVKRSGVSPIRMLKAYRSLIGMEQGGAGMLTEALEKAVLHSTWAELGQEGVSLIAMDVSNSMRRPLYAAGSAASATIGAGNAANGANAASASANAADTVQRFDIAPLVAGLWKSRGNQLITGILGNTWKQQELPDRPVLMGAHRFRTHENEAGYALNAWLIFQDLLRKGQVVDRVLIFTDCRLWDNRSFNQTAGTDLRHWWRLYRDKLIPDAKLYLFDLAGYGSRPLEHPEDGVCQIAGWNEKTFEILGLLNKNKIGA